MRYLPYSIIAISLLACHGCGSGDEHDSDENPCIDDTRGDVYTQGMNRVGAGGYSFAILDSLPAPPDKGLNIWQIELKDSSDSPVTGVDWNGSLYMPDHGHPGPAPVFREDSAGRYTIDPVNLFMPGLFEVTLAASNDGTKLDEVTFKFCVEG